MKRLLVVLAFLMSIPTIGYSQSMYRSTNVGVGMGMDYGGIGGRISLAANQNLGFFWGLGYNLSELGYNFGTSLFLSPEKRNIPYLTAMYGYNGVVVVSNQESLNKTFYGLSFGFGYECHSAVEGKEKNFWNFELLVPLRESGFNDYMDDLEDNYGVDFKSKPWPISFSIGYHFGF